MKIFLAFIAGLLAYYFFRWVRRRGAYYNQVERELQRMKVDSSQVDKKYGRGKYHASMEYMLKQGLTPEETARAIAADLSGEYNAFLEKLNAEAQAGEAPETDALVGKIRAAHEQSAQLGEMLAAQPMPDKKDTPSIRAFGDRIDSFVTALHVNLGVQIEEGSMGHKIIDAVSQRDMNALFDLQETVMKKIHKLSGESRADYVFQIFWPKIQKGLTTRP